MYRNFEGGCMIVGINAALKGNFYPGKGFVIIITSAFPSYSGTIDLGLNHS